MKLFAALLLSLFPGIVMAQTAGNAQAGKALWDTNQQTQCRNCHGVNGEGGLGPDLAGRKLTVAQFTKALRTPWGIMPAYRDSVISDSDVANLVAYLEALPAVAPAPWRFTVPANAPRGQEFLVSFGCAQCHQPAFANPRGAMGGMGAGFDFELFKRYVYDHEASMPEFYKTVGEQPPPRVRMGDYSRTRLPESVLREIWNWAEDVGRRPMVASTLSAGVPGAGGVTYTLHVHNAGLKGKGLGVEDLTIVLALPAGATVATTTGAGYQGVRQDAQLKATAAVWQLPRLAAGEEQTYTITLSKAGTAADNVRGMVRWAKPATKIGPDEAAIPPAPTAPATK